MRAEQVLQDDLEAILMRSSQTITNIAQKYKTYVCVHW